MRNACSSHPRGKVRKTASSVEKTGMGRKVTLLQPNSANTYKHKHNLNAINEKYKNQTLCSSSVPTLSLGLT